MLDRTETNTDLAFGDFTIVRSDERVQGPSGPLRLGRKAYHVLLTLADRDGELVTKDELFSTVWNKTIVSDSALTSVIKELRRALGDRSEEPAFIESVYGRGYRFLPPVSLLPHSARPRAPSAKLAAAGSGPIRPAPARSVAVLPFTNLTGDESRTYLSDGLAEELIAILSRVGGLQVPARTSSFAYRGRDTDVRDIGRQLGVGAVVEGSVRASGDRIRLTVQLIDAATGFHLWSDNFDRGLGDLLDLQDDLARSVASALGRELARDPRATGSAEAMRLHLQARSMAARLTGEALGRSEALLRRAIALDPAFARAREGLAGTLLVAINTGAMAHDARGEARREAEHALALDPSLSGAQGIIACLDALRGDWNEAERNFTAAIERDEANSVAHEALAHYVLLPTGAHRRARAHAARSLELSPARAAASFLCALCEMPQGDPAAASGYLDMAVMLGMSARFPPLRIVRGGCLLAEGRLDEAGAEVAAALPAVALDAGGEAIAKQVYRALGGIGDRGAAITQVSALFEACRKSEAFWRDASLPGYLFGWQGRLGAIDEAYRLASVLVERKRETRHLATASLNHIWLPAMAPFRADRRFDAFVRDLGMWDYWTSSGPPDGYVLRGGRLVPS